MSLLVPAVEMLSLAVRELVTLLCTVAWLQRGELVLAAKWEHKLNMRLEPASPTFWAYAVAGVTCEESRESLSPSVYLARGKPVTVPLRPSFPSTSRRLWTCQRVEVGWKLECFPNSLDSLYVLQ